MPAGTAIKLRRDTAANWTSANPVLRAGEPGYETDTFKLKIGDNATAWNSLAYFAGGGGASAFTDLTDAPASYTGEAGKLVAVKGTEDGLAFIATPSSVRAGTATLATGTVTVAATWVTADTVIVVTGQAAPGTAGTNLYVDPANIVADTSFDISSDDATDDRAVFWIATEPTELSESGMALQAGGAAYLEKDLGSAQTEVWMTFDMAFDATALAYWESVGYDVFAALWFDDESGIEWIVNAGPIWEDFGMGPPRPTVSSPAPVADTWQHIEYHYRGSDCLLELYIDGTLADSHVLDAGPDPLYDMRYVVIGQVYGDADPDEDNVYYKNIKVGTTREGTDLFSENFGGDLSAWTVTGGCAIVADPF